MRFISACQNLTKKRNIDHPVRKQSAQSGCIKQEMPPEMLTALSTYRRSDELRAG
jgi:hypothetical protein